MIPIFTNVFLLFLTVGAQDFYGQQHEQKYIADFSQIDANSYSAVDDASNANVPTNLITDCGDGNEAFDGSANTVFLSGSIDNGNVILSSQAAIACNRLALCVVPAGLELRMDASLHVGALLVKGTVVWHDALPSENKYMCAGYIAMDGGTFDMNLQEDKGWIYLRDNGAKHQTLYARAFGGINHSTITVKGRELARTWSLLAKPMAQGDSTIELFHDTSSMGWRVGDRLGLAPTEKRSLGHGEAFRITKINTHTITATSLVNPEDDGGATYSFAATFDPPTPDMIYSPPALQSAEVVNLERNIVITGDKFRHVACTERPLSVTNPNSVAADICLCNYMVQRTKCTVGLHVLLHKTGTMSIEHTRVEKCGQRGIAGKYCGHFHLMGNCPDCVFRGNSYENGHQRGIVVHGTHGATVEDNVFYNIRGANIYFEDGNEMFNNIKYNVVICPIPFRKEGKPWYWGCTVPGTDNQDADSAVNQSGFYSRGMTNALIGNRAANTFNGMLWQATNSNGKGFAKGKVCERDAIFGHLEGNTFHSHGRFGTYSLNYNYPKNPVVTTQSIEQNGYMLPDDGSLLPNNPNQCSGFSSDGETRGYASAIKNSFDYGNAFVGHYEAGDLQYNGHQSYDNIELMYWKETKNFENGCSAHLKRGKYSRGNLALPDIGTFIIEDTFVENATFESAHHCNIGTTGYLCFPQYMLHNVRWKNEVHSQWVIWEKDPHQNPNRGGIFTLSPPNALQVSQGIRLEESFFPHPYVSLVSNKYTYLITHPDCNYSKDIGITQVERLRNGEVYGENSILCKVPLRVLRIYTKDVVSNIQMKLKVWFKKEVDEEESNESTFEIVDHFSITPKKQGYAIPVVPGDENTYKISVKSSTSNLFDADIPDDWYIDFSDTVIGNRYNEDIIKLRLQGDRECGNDDRLSSHHSRKWLWSGDENELWSNKIPFGEVGTHGACINPELRNNSQPPKQEFKKCVSQSVDNSGFDLEPSICTCSSKCTDSQYCDCATKQCVCKPGFSGDSCVIDLCHIAKCGSHGTCSTTYLGGKIPVTNYKVACICDDGWTGPFCDTNVCDNVDCGVGGTCVAYGDSNHYCHCKKGYIIEKGASTCTYRNCDDSCSNKKLEPWYGCNPLGYPDYKYFYCHNAGLNVGCGQIKEGQSTDFCIYYSTPELPCNGNKCTSLDECKFYPNECSKSGSACPVLVNREDGYPCHSKSLSHITGLCESGECISTKYHSPSMQPSLSITPTILPSKAMSTLPSTSNRPSDSHTLIPTSNPVEIMTYCGCYECTEKYWKNPIYVIDNPDATCQTNIEWLLKKIVDKSLEEACSQVALEYPIECGKCNPKSCLIDSDVPSFSPSKSPSSSPSEAPIGSTSSSPTIISTGSPTSFPTLAPIILPSCEDDKGFKYKNRSCKKKKINKKKRCKTKKLSCKQIKKKKRCKKKMKSGIEVKEFCKKSCRNCPLPTTAS